MSDIDTIHLIVYAIKYVNNDKKYNDIDSNKHLLNEIIDILSNTTTTNTTNTTNTKTTGSSTSSNDKKEIIELGLPYHQHILASFDEAEWRIKMRKRKSATDQNTWHIPATSSMIILKVCLVLFQRITLEYCNDNSDSNDTNVTNTKAKTSKNTNKKSSSSSSNRQELLMIVKNVISVIMSKYINDNDDGDDIGFEQYYSLPLPSKLDH